MKFPNFCGSHVGEPLFAVLGQLRCTIILTGGDNDVAVFGNATFDKCIKFIWSFVRIKYLGAFYFAILWVYDDHVEASQVIGGVLLELGAAHCGVVDGDFGEVASVVPA